MKFFNLLILLTIITSCASYKDTVYTMDNESKPSWVKMDQPTWEKDGKVFAVSVAEVPHDSNFSSAKRISDNAARSSLAKLIKNKLVSDLNVQEPDLKSKEMSLNSSEYVDLVVRKMRVENNWFELVEVDNLDDTKRKQMHVYSLVSIKKEDLDKLAKENTDVAKKE